MTDKEMLATITLAICIGITLLILIVGITKKKSIEDEVTSIIETKTFQEVTKEVEQAKQEVVETIVINQDTNFIYIDIPDNKLDKFEQLYKKWDHNDSTFSKDRRTFWRYVKSITDEELKPYMHDNIVYEWHVVFINSNTVCVSNTAEFGFNNRQHLEHYTRSK